MIEAILVFLACVWLVYKFVKSKNLRFLFAAVMIFLLQLVKWPLFLPILIPSSGMAFASAGFMFYQYVYRQKDKNALPYIIMFILFGLMFCIYAYSNTIIQR